MQSPSAHQPFPVSHSPSGLFLAAGHDDLAGADEFHDLEFLQELDHGVQLLGVAGAHDDDGLLGHVHGLGLEMVSDPQLQVEGDFALQVLTRARMGLRDIVNNYPLLLGEAMPGSVEDIIGVYRNEILPQMDDLIDELAEETGIDPDTVTPAESRQHLYALPPEVF